MFSSNVREKDVNFGTCREQEFILKRLSSVLVEGKRIVRGSEIHTLGRPILLRECPSSPPNKTPVDTAQ